MVVYFSLNVFFRNGMMLVTVMTETKAPADTWAIGYAIVLALTAAILVLVWNLAPWISAKACQGVDDAGIKPPSGPDEWETWGFSLIGLWFTMDGLVLLAQHLLNALSGPFFGASMNIHLVQPVVKLAGGFLLLRYAKIIAATAHKLRS